VITENSVRISAGILVARLSQISSMHIGFLVDKPSESNKDGQSLLLAQSSRASKCREFVSRKNPVLDQQKFGRVDQGEATFPLKEAKRRRNRLAPAKRRVAGMCLPKTPFSGFPPNVTLLHSDRLVCGPQCPLFNVADFKGIRTG
jgi:hypothetical protein